MNALMMALAALRGISTLLSNPALGGGSSVRFGEAAELLNLLGSLVEEGEDAFEDLKAFTESISAMAASGHGPTPAEWETIRERGRVAHDRLQAVKEELTGPVISTGTAEEDPVPEPEEAGEDPEEDPAE
jgi:hypothetical protein